MDITQKDWENFKQTGIGKVLFQYLKKNQEEYKKQILNIVTASPLGSFEVERLKWLNAANCVLNSLQGVTIEEIQTFLEADHEL